MKPLAIAFVMASLTLLGLASVAVARVGSVGLAVGYYFRGETLLVDSVKKSLGAVSPGETALVSYKIRNAGGDRMRIVGCRAGCSCAVPSQLPFELAPGESRDFSVTIHVPPKKQMDGSSIDLSFTLFTSSAAQPRIQLAAHGELR